MELGSGRSLCESWGSYKLLGDDRRHFIQIEFRHLALGTTNTGYLRWKLNRPHGKQACGDEPIEGGRARVSNSAQEPQSGVSGALSQLSGRLLASAQVMISGWGDRARHQAPSLAQV